MQTQQTQTHLNPLGFQIDPLSYLTLFPICGFLRQPKIDKKRFHPCQKNTPILIGHGKDDDKVPVKASKNAYGYLKKQEANVELFLYSGKHKIGMDYMKKVKEIIQL